MSNEIVKHQSISAPASFTDEQVELIKSSFCKGLTDDEFKIFLYTCQRTGLDPFAKQIYAVKRKDYKLNREVMTIQTGIDGYRLIADRSGTYAPGPEPTFVYDAQGKLISATASVKKLTRDGTWHVVSATAFYEEYAQTTKEGREMGMWGKMPRTMLAKCAESLALRKANPADLSGIYTKEEMEQADVVDVTPSHDNKVRSLTVQFISNDEASELANIIADCNPEKQSAMWEFIHKKCGGNDLLKLPKECLPKIKNVLLERRAEYQASLIKEEPRSMDEVENDIQ